MDIISEKRLNEKKENDFNNIISFFSENEFVKKVGISNILKGFVAIAGTISVYLFYSIGYSFLYGFYFGGDSNFISLFDIMINPIPINFKSIIAVGVVLLLLTCLQCIPLWQIFFRGEKNQLLISWITYLIIIISSSTSLGCIFYGSLEKLNLVFTVCIGLIVVLIPLVSFLVLYLMKMAIKNTVRFTLSLFLSIFSAIVIFILSNGSWAKYLAFPYTFVAISVFCVIIGRIGRIKHIKLLKSKCFKGKFKTKKVQNQASNRVGNSRLNKNQLLVSFFVYIIASAIFCYVAVIQLSVVLGNSLSGVLEKRPIERITYQSDSDSKYSEAFGNVVAEKNGTYYISEFKEKKLFIIKSANIKINQCSKEEANKINE